MRKHPRILATITAIGLSSIGILSLQSPSLASSNWQERDGIAGEIKYARVCNQTSGFQYRVITDTVSRNRRVTGIDFKIYSAYSFGVNAWGNQIGWANTPAWRNFISVNNNGRFTDMNQTRLLQSIVGNTPVSVAIHVRHTGGTTIDLGGIVNLGDIPLGQCRTYDDGRYLGY